jgi:hypothetical protein
MARKKYIQRLKINKETTTGSIQMARPKRSKVIQKDRRTK